MVQYGTIWYNSVLYVYIYIYIERERKKERERERERNNIMQYNIIIQYAIL